MVCICRQRLQTTNERTCSDLDKSCATSSVDVYWRMYLLWQWSATNKTGFLSVIMTLCMAHALPQSLYKR
jgi:hypothetical protein